MKTGRLREIVEVLRESWVYYTLSHSERLALVKTIVEEKGEKR